VVAPIDAANPVPAVRGPPAHRVIATDDNNSDSSLSISPPWRRTSIRASITTAGSRQREPAARAAARTVTASLTPGTGGGTAGGGGGFNLSGVDKFSIRRASRRGTGDPIADGIASSHHHDRRRQQRQRHDGGRRSRHVSDPQPGAGGL
jgi:hypothetical protein